MRARRFFKESFIPVLGLLIVLLGAVFYAEQQAITVNEQTVTIEIPGAVVGAHNIGANDASSEYDDTALPAAQIGDEDSGGAGDQRYQGGLDLMKAGKWAEAEAFFRKAIASEPSSQAYTELSQCLLNLGQTQQALAMARKALTIKPVYERAAFNHALILSKSGDDAAALKAYDAIIRDNPVHFNAHFNRGLILLNSHKLDDAVKSFTRASQLAGGDKKARALFNLGISYRRLGEKHYPQALKAFQQSLRIRPGDVATRLMIGASEPLTAEGYTRALEQFDIALKLQPENPEVYFQIGLLNSNHKHNAKAKKAYTRALKLSPSYIKAHYNLGLIYLREDKWDNALNHFQAITGIHSNHAAAHFNIGRAKYGRKDYQGAIAAYDLAIKLQDGDYPEAYLNRGLTFRKLAELDNAIASYKKALDLKPDYPEAWYNLAIAYMRKDMNNEAEQAIKQALEYNPRYHQAWLNLGVLYARENRNQAAIDAYNQALSIKPDYTRAMLNLASRYQSNNQTAQAIELYSRALAGDASNQEAWQTLGLLQLDSGDSAKAEDSLRQALALENNNLVTRLALARTLFSGKKYQDCITLLEETIEMDNANTELRLLLAQSLRLSGRIDEALVQINLALQLAPDNAELITEKKLINSAR